MPNCPLVAGATLLTGATARTETAALAGAAALPVAIAFLAKSCLMPNTRLYLTSIPFCFRVAITSFADAVGVDARTLRIASLLFTPDFLAMLYSPERNVVIAG